MEELNEEKNHGRAKCSFFFMEGLNEENHLCVFLLVLCLWTHGHVDLKDARPCFSNKAIRCLEFRHWNL